MEHPETHVVKSEDERPVSKGSNACTYCREPIGGTHKPDCVIRTRTVVCEFKVTLVRRVPENWDEHQIEFHMNDSSWCASNLIEELQSISSDERCLCDQIEGKFVREATAEDEARYEVTR